MIPILILRPEPGASDTAARARSLGLEPIVAPLFEARPVAWDPPTPETFNGLLLTSANAIRHGGPKVALYRNLPVHAVGQATATAARESGFEVATVGRGNVDDLLRQIPGAQHLLHLAGEDRRSPEPSSHSIDAVIVYKSGAIEQALPNLPIPLVALIHSPRAGERFAALTSDREGVTIAAISRAAAVACGSGWAAMAVADSPSDDALLSLAAQLCKGLPRS